MSCSCCVTFPRGAMGLSAVCDCGISLLYSLTVSEMSQIVEIYHFVYFAT